MFEPLGFIYNPIKEKSINTARHISKGRADTAIASLVIKFKQPLTLSNKINKAKAISQISDYLLGLKSEDNEIVEGYVTNGVEGCFVSGSTPSSKENMGRGKESDKRDKVRISSK